MAVKVLSKTMDSTKLSSEKSEFVLHRNNESYAKVIHSRICHRGKNKGRCGVPSPVVRRGDHSSIERAWASQDGGG